METGILRQATEEDWRSFLNWSRRENWLVTELEQRLLRKCFSEAALALAEDSACCGFVTAVCHGRTGWIGNLLVPGEMRGKGIGRRLFLEALQRLTDQGAASIWLTASEMGRPLYEQYGFTVVGTIERWILDKDTDGTGVDPGDPIEELAAADRTCWNDTRSRLLDGLADGNRIFQTGDALTLFQRGRDLQVIGPWYANRFDAADNRQLLETCLAAASSGRIAIDMPAGHPCIEIVRGSGFTRHGENRLMVRGAFDTVCLESMAALASLGSIG